MSSNTALLSKHVACDGAFLNAELGAKCREHAPLGVHLDGYDTCNNKTADCYAVCIYNTRY